MSLIGSLMTSSVQAADTWSGNGADANWQTAGNWDTLPVALDALQFGGTNKLTNNNNFAAGTQFNGINFLAGAGSFNLGGNAVLLGGDISDNSTNAQTISLPLLLDGATSNVTVAPGGSLSLGQLTFGLNAQSVNVSTLNLNSNVSATGLAVQTKSTGNNIINIAAGSTFTVGGLVTIGTPATASGGGNVNTNLNFTGGGNLSVSNTSATSTDFFIGLGNVNLNAADHNVARVDMTQLANFTYTTGATGTGRFGVGWATRPDAQLRLTPGTNTIVAASVTVGNSSGTPILGGTDNAGAISTLFLGTGSNIINTGSIGLGQDKGAGTIDWQSSSSGSLIIAGQAGGATKANITVNQQSAGTGSPLLSELKLAGHDVTVQAANVVIGSNTTLAGTIGSTGTFSAGAGNFDTGTFTADSFQLAVHSANTGPAIGTFYVGASYTTSGTNAAIVITPVPNPTATGVFTVNNTFSLANQTSANTVGAANGNIGTFGVYGGSANINADMLDASTAGTRTTNLTVAGGTLNMMGHNIGSVAAPITNVNLTGGTLSNAANVFANAFDVSGVNFSNSSGTTTLQISNGGTFTASAPPLTLPSGVVLAGGGATGATVTGDIVAGSGSRIAPGNSTTAGTVTFNNSLTLNSGSNLTFKLSDNQFSGNDLINANNGLTLSGTVNLQIGNLGLGPQPNSTYTLFNYFGTLTGDQTNFNVTGNGSRTHLHHRADRFHAGLDSGFCRRYRSAVDHLEGERRQ